MNRQQLEHIIRAAADVTGQPQLIIIGSQAILGQFPNAPEPLLISMEADIYAPDAPELSNAIDRALGPDSLFDKTHGYHADGVDRTTASLPSGWSERLIRICNPTPTAQSDGASTSTTSRSRNTQPAGKRTYATQVTCGATECSIRRRSRSGCGTPTSNQRTNRGSGSRAPLPDSNACMTRGCDADQARRRAAQSKKKRRASAHRALAQAQRTAPAPRCPRENGTSASARIPTSHMHIAKTLRAGLITLWLTGLHRVQGRGARRLARRDIPALLDRKDILIIDTETTGIDARAEVVEIAAVDTTGALRFRALSIPVGPISHQS